MYEEYEKTNEEPKTQAEYEAMMFNIYEEIWDDERRKECDTIFA